MNYLITGGAGFIGSNLAYRLLEDGHKVTIYDNFSRVGVNNNIKWLKKTTAIRSEEIVKGDVRDFNKLQRYVSKADVVFHLAAQVAVTTSVLNPREDYEINIGGTLNVLEAARQDNMPIVVYSSTNKVYGNLKDKVVGGGITEDQNLDFHSPYGCSKGAADQYVRDYFRIYNLPTIVFRQSCIYGERQMGMEDQGWLAHFAIKILNNEQITIFGDGKQIRDLLYVDDLIDAYLLAVKNIKEVKGEIFNIGGGKENAVSIMDAISLIEEKLNQKAKIKFAESRHGDQKIFISNNNRLKKLLGFKVKTNYNEGLEKLILWLQSKK